MANATSPALPAGSFRTVVAAVLAVASLSSFTAGSGAARADSPAVACWTVRPVEGPVLRCRGTDGQLTDHGSDPGFARFPATGWDVWGECWYDSTAPGSAAVRGDWAAETGARVVIAGVGAARGLAAVDPLRRCRSEPTSNRVAGQAMGLARGFGFSPGGWAVAPLRGVAGLESTMQIPGRRVVEFVQGFPEWNESLHLRLEGIPSRVAWEAQSPPVAVAAGSTIGHQYERSGRYRITTELEWTGWWSVSWDPGWREFSIGPFHGSRGYEVDEIVARLVG